MPPYPELNTQVSGDKNLSAASFDPTDKPKNMVTILIKNSEQHHLAYLPLKILSLDFKT